MTGRQAACATSENVLGNDPVYRSFHLTLSEDTQRCPWTPDILQSQEFLQIQELTPYEDAGGRAADCSPL